jgi:ankyrin repeat protein
MHWAAWEGHIQILELLLENGAELNPRNHDGHTPLAYAQKRQHRLAAQWLQDRGATL